MPEPTKLEEVVQVTMKVSELTTILNHAQFGLCVINDQRELAEKLLPHCLFDMAKMGLDHWVELMDRLAVPLSKIEGLTVTMVDEPNGP